MDTLYPFIKCTPEEVGIASGNVKNFVDELDKRGLSMHGMMIVRHGKVCAEGYWAPFHEDYLHRMYSCSKSFTSTAIGILAGEGKISLTEPLVNYFPEYKTDCQHPYKAKMCVRDLLMMATPYEGGSYEFTDPDWVKAFFTKLTPTHPAGTIWHYDTSGTHTLSALVERVSGMTLPEFLYDRVFRYMGGSEDMWCIKAPEGNSWGGSGMVARQRDLARLGYLWMNYGRFNGQQLVPEEYIREGSSNQIDNCLLGLTSRNHKRGYGYQVWMEPRGAFSFWGMGTQYCVCFRDQDLMLVTTANTIHESIDEEYVFNTFERTILNHLTDDTLPENKEAFDELNQRLSSLSLVMPEGKESSPKCSSKISGKTYRLCDNRMGISKVRFEFSPDGLNGKVYYTNAQGDKEIEFAGDHYVEGKFPQWGYNFDTIGKPSDRRFRSLSCGTWTEENKLMVTTWLEDIHCGLVTMKFSFTDNGNTVALMFCKCGENILNEYYGNASGQAVD